MLSWFLSLLNLQIMAAVDRDPTTVSPTPAPAGVPKYVLDYGKKFERGVFKLVSRLGSTVLFKILQAVSVHFTVYKTHYALSCQEVFPVMALILAFLSYHRHTSLPKMCCLLIHVSRCLEIFIIICFFSLVFLGGHESNLIPQPLWSIYIRRSYTSLPT